MNDQNEIQATASDTIAMEPAAAVDTSLQILQETNDIPKVQAPAPESKLTNLLAFIADKETFFFDREALHVLLDIYSHHQPNSPQHRAIMAQVDRSEEMIMACLDDPKRANIGMWSFASYFKTQLIATFTAGHTHGRHREGVSVALTFVLSKSGHFLSVSRLGLYITTLPSRSNSAIVDQPELLQIRQLLPMKNRKDLQIQQPRPAQHVQGKPQKAQAHAKFYPPNPNVNHHKGNGGSQQKHQHERVNSSDVSVKAWMAEFVDLAHDMSGSEKPKHAGGQQQSKRNKPETTPVKPVQVMAANEQNAAEAQVFREEKTVDISTPQIVSKFDQGDGGIAQWKTAGHMAVRNTPQPIDIDPDKGVDAYEAVVT